jgi:REP element-mobilizing transposase RayT
MIYPEKRNIYSPFHIYKDDTIYFITARTVEKEKLFDIEKKKKIFYRTLKNVLERYNYLLYAWTILDNHYHLLMKIAEGENLKFFVKDLHALSAKRLNELDDQA